MDKKNVELTSSFIWCASSAPLEIVWLLSNGNGWYYRHTVLFVHSLGCSLVEIPVLLHPIDKQGIQCIILKIKTFNWKLIIIN